MPGFSVEGHVLVELLMREERHDGGVVGVEPGPLGSCPGTTFSRYLGFVWPAWCSYRLPCVADPVTDETNPRVVILVVEDDVESLEMTVVRLVVVPIDGEVRPLEVLFTGIDDV